jgi:hypothetical protein
MYQALTKPEENMHLRALIPIIYWVEKLDPIVITRNLMMNWASDEISPKRAYHPASFIVTVLPLQAGIIF